MKNYLIWQRVCKSSRQKITLLFFTGCVLLTIYSCNNRNTTEKANETGKELWTCSMHPEIIRDKPGACPICGMDLVRKVENGQTLNDIQVNDLLRPTDQFVISSIPVTTIKTKSEPIEVEALGAVDYDTRLINTLSARVSGRIEKLYVKYRYQHITNGQHILDIYSPELLTTQQELLFLIKNDPGNSALINAAKQKLLLLGMSEGQVRQVVRTSKPSMTVAVYSNYSGHIHEAGNLMPGERTGEQKMDISRVTEELAVKEGMYVEKGQNIFQIYDVNKSWVVLSIFPEYQGLVRVGDPVRIIPETSPSRDFRARIDFIEPFFRKENKTMTARVYFNNSELQIPVGGQVRANIFSNSYMAVWLPKTAVLSLGMDKVVFLKTGPGFIARAVKTGFSYNDQIQIISGLRPEDSVAVNAQYLADSESFIKTK